MNIKEILEEVLKDRAQTHGNINNVADFHYRIQAVHRDSGNWSEMTDTQKLCLDMIAHKLARILAGDPNAKDHWHDIAGYSIRAAESIYKAEKDVQG